ncbi:MAG: cell division protein ZapD [Burkholderiales bacterium]|nr:cell division protein ZapD [Burkholderiales bacterium]
MITYEYPLSERVRTLLRLEDLFARTRHFLERQDSHDHHAALAALFEIIDVAGRADLKSDLMQELERQRQVLSTFRGSPDVAQDALEQVLREADATFSSLASNAVKTGQHLRENEWLMSVKSRISIPGGACEFDLPSYHFWLHRPSAARLADLNAWLAPLLPVRDGISIVLRLLRDSGKPAQFSAAQGQFQQMLSGRVAQLIRLRIPSDLQIVPEISANKYALMIRFMSIPADSDGSWSAQRPRQAEAAVPFELTYCNL